jgi:DNA-binding FadR family transcriptional regulator
VILKLVGEVRQQLGLQLSISRTLVDLRIVKEFHHTVVEAIREESPETARRIVARLKERRALRPSGELPTLTGGPDADLG